MLEAQANAMQALEPPVRVRLLRYTRDGPLLVAAAARITVSKKPVERAMEMGPGEVEKWIRELVRRGHGSPLEHAVYTFEAECSRVCSHQLVRHRLASYTQQSMRYTEGFLRSMALKVCSIMGVGSCPERPTSANDYRVYETVLREAAGRLEGPDGSGWALIVAASRGYVFNPSWSPETMARVARAYLGATAEYYGLLAGRVPREDARMVIPQAVRTRIVFTMNARELLESFLPLRMCSHAQWEIRMLAWGVWRELMKVHPEIFRYAGPRCILEENRVRPEPCSLEQYLNGDCDFTIPRCPEMVPKPGIRSCLRYAAESSRASAGPRGLGG